MKSIRNRAKKRFPTVLLTLLSIVQALALEFLWDHSRHRPELYEATATALIGWLQIAASLNVVILIWLAYAGMVMRFRWTPTTADSIWPFFVGLIQFQMIDLMGTDNLGRWLVVLALLFALMSLVNHQAMKRARLDKANREFFDHFDAATFKDFIPLCVTVAVLVIAGGWLWNTDNSGWPAIVALFVTAVGLANEIRNAAQYWRVSMGIE
jgi:hypothetical protein